MKALDEIAPFPKNAEEATADNLARALTASAYLASGLIDFPGPDASKDEGRRYGIAVKAVTREFAAAYLLRVLKHELPGMADELARRLFGMWSDGDVDEWMWDWLRGYGIDPDVFEPIAAAIKAEQKAGRTHIRYTATGFGATTTEATGQVVLNIDTTDGRVDIDLGTEFAEPMGLLLLDDPEHSDGCTFDDEEVESHV
jgi:hypothetical protein